MMRAVASSLALVVLVGAAAAQPSESRGQFALHQSNRDIGWVHNERLAFLGERLFFDARLSGTGRTACASCHDPAYAYAEPRRVSVFDSGRQGRRNAPSLLDVGVLPI